MSKIGHSESIWITSIGTIEVIQIDLEWPILAVFQLFQYFLLKWS